MNVDLLFSQWEVNLQSYPLSLYLDRGKKGMIHLLVGSYVQKPDSVFFLWLVDKQYLRFVVCCLWISCHISTRHLARSWSEYQMVQMRASFCKDEFSFEAPMNFNYNSLKAECCSGEDILAVKFSQRVSWKTKGVGMFQNCLQNENRDIFHRSTLG